MVLRAAVRLAACYCSGLDKVARHACSLSHHLAFTSLGTIDGGRANEELKLTALASDAAGSLRSPAALLMVRRSLTPAR